MAQPVDFCSNRFLCPGLSVPFVVHLLKSGSHKCNSSVVEVVLRLLADTNQECCTEMNSIAVAAFCRMACKQCGNVCTNCECHFKAFYN